MPKLEVRPNCYLGIDPGNSGGMVCLSSGSNRVVDSFPFGNSTDHQIADWLMRNQPRIVRAALEQVSAMPGQGVVSMFTFGKSYGFLRGLLTAMGIPFVEVRPQVWQKRLNIPKKGKSEQKPEFKKRLQAEAHRRWPDRINDIGRAVADAALIAEWLRLEEVGR